MKHETIIGLETIPNSKKFSIDYNNWTETLRVKVQEKALKGEANQRLVKELEKIFKAKALIVSGEKNRKKKIKINLPEEKVTAILSETLILEK